MEVLGFPAAAFTIQVLVMYLKRERGEKEKKKSISILYFSFWKNCQFIFDKLLGM